VQEALTNVGKHARAAKVSVRVAEQGGTVDVEVSDDGVGFEPARRPARGYGLQAMRERAEELGGRLDVHSRRGAGTRVEVRL